MGYRFRRALLGAAVTIAVGIAPGANADDVAPATPSWLGDVPGLGATAPDAPAPQGALTLRGCTITNPLFGGDPERVRELIPEHYDLGSNPYLGPTAATMIAAVLACDGSTLDGDERGAVTLNLFGVQILSEAAEDGSAVDAAWTAYNASTLNFLPSSSWYLLEAHTDNESLADVLSDSGLPVAYVKNFVYSTAYMGALAKDSVQVAPHPKQPYSLVTSTRLPDPFVHNHDWTFWHEAAAGKVGLHLHLHAMSDTSCGYNFHPLVRTAEPSCGTTLAASPDSSIGRYFDIGDAGVIDTPLAFNHPVSDSPGYLLLLGDDANPPGSHADHQHGRTP